MNHLQTNIYLDFLKNKTEAKLEWGPSGSWSHEDYTDLSNIISATTGVTLSNTTLKRVWGHVKYESSPSQTTLNTLAIYTGYANWRELKLDCDKMSWRKVKSSFIHYRQDSNGFQPNSITGCSFEFYDN